MIDILAVSTGVTDLAPAAGERHSSDDDDDDDGDDKVIFFDNRLSVIPGVTDCTL